METRYITSAAKPEQLPANTLPEVAFVGRSNCGKSTLINALLGRRQLARTSRTPGQTKMINFFGRGPDHWIADLPGYGYHKAAYEDARSWQALVSAYMRRPNIRHILFLIDIRREWSQDDLSFVYDLGRQLPVLVVLTKADKLNRNQVEQAKRAARSALEEWQVSFEDVVAISSSKKQGVEELQQVVFNKENLY